MPHKLKKLITDDSGAIIIEATVSLSIFMFAIVVVLSIVNICYAQMKIGIAVNETAKEISQYGYIYGLTGFDDKQQELDEKGEESRELIDGTVKSLVGVWDGMKGLGDTAQEVSTNNVYESANSIRNNLKNVGDSALTVKDNVSQVIDDPKAFVLGLVALEGNKLAEKAKAHFIVAPLAKSIFKKTLKYDQNSDNAPFLKKLGIIPTGTSYIDGLDFTDSSFCANGKHKINVVVKYQIKVLELLGNDITLNFVQHGETNCWTSKR